MTAFADGFLPLHIELGCAPGQTKAVATHLKALKAPLRAGTLDTTPTGLLAALEAIPGVTRVDVEGPQSALLIPLRMLQTSGLVQETTMSAIVGTGPIADRIAEDLASWGITLQAQRLDSADSPLEFSVRDPDGASESVKLYPASRAHYRGRLTPPTTTPELLLLNRSNQGLLRLAADVRDAGGAVSLRIRAQGRFDDAEGLLRAIAHSDQVCVSARSGALRQVAKVLGLTTPRGWPGANPDDLWRETARRLATHEGGARTIALMPQGRPATMFCVADGEPQWFELSETFDPASRMARLQGAVAIAQLEEDAPLGAWAPRALTRAYEGTQGRPWRY